MMANQLSAAPSSDEHGRLFVVAIFVLALAGFALVAWAYWPGVMIDDARWQYQQAVDNAYEDWHPPLMAWIWHMLIPLRAGPAPMLLLQLGLYWSGIGLIGTYMFRRGRKWFGIAAALGGWIPASLALLGSVTKDSLMTGSLLLAVGLLLWTRGIGNRTARVALGVGAMLALLFASALRVNAFFACTPLAVALVPSRFTRTPLRLILTASLAAAVFAAIPWVIARGLNAEDTDAQLSLIIFDLGGITEDSGTNQFPDLHVANSVAVNHRCYDPAQWDSYSTWAIKPCPLGFDAFQSLVDEGDTDPRMIWLRAISSHPIAYVEHRLAYFNLSTWFLVSGGPDFTAWKQSVPNPWNFQVRQTTVLKAIDGAANAGGQTPFGWPIFWIAIALAIVVASRVGRLDRIATSIAVSAFVYGAGYAIVGVATGMRYYMWAISGAAIAAVLAASDLSERTARRRFAIVVAPVVIVPTGLAALARLVL
jgi:hypothetical protein